MVQDGAGFASDDDEDGEARQLHAAKALSKNVVPKAGAPRGGSKKAPAHQMV